MRWARADDLKKVRKSPGKKGVLRRGFNEAKEVSSCRKQLRAPLLFISKGNVGPHLWFLYVFVKCFVILWEPHGPVNLDFCWNGSTFFRTGLKRWDALNAASLHLGAI